ncbi:ribosome biogenesis protein SLX9-domain-containing protein [Panaeolus papilionaceus]|nr:ribosome biogenesis protein SLX9-domain-containing protein [Panaeolus papilionaceus]
MPKASRIRHPGHLSSAKPAQLNTVDSDVQIDFSSLGTSREFSSTVDPAPESEQTEIKLKQTKKAKEIERRQAFLQKLEIGQRLFSKSHERRLKRKEREQLAGGMNQLQVALDQAVNADQETAAQTTIAEAEQSQSTAKDKAASKAGLIGKNGSSTLSKAQRKKALELERLRHPFILKNPDFSANPFHTIRTHAQNTLIKHEAP